MKLGLIPYQTAAGPLGYVEAGRVVRIEPARPSAPEGIASVILLENGEGIYCRDAADALATIYSDLARAAR